jgi:HK97 family phage major capsid protein
LRNGQLSNSLLGYPVELSDVMPDDTDDGDLTPFILFGDLKYRAFGDRKQLSLSA